MNLAELKQKGACVDVSPVRKSIAWTHRNEKGDEVTDTIDVWVQRLSFGTIDRLTKADESDRSRNAELISLCVRLGEHAEESMPYEIAYTLQPSLAIELVRVISEVNRLKPEEDKDGPKD